MPTLEQATNARLREIAEIFRSGYSELTGKTKRAYGERSEEVGGIIGRFRGVKNAFPELHHLSDSPKSIAAAIERGKGVIFRRVHATVQDEMRRKGFLPARRRSLGPLVVPPHAGRAYCRACGVVHSEGQHRFHGSDAFLRTHLFPFATNMNLSEARRIFAELMQVARHRTLKPAERERLSKARQLLRRAARPAMNQTRKQARAILHRGKVHGRRLTPRQQGFFGARASGYPRVNAGLVRMGKLVELRYRRDWGKKPGFYKHRFASTPTVYYDPRRKTIVIR